MSGKLQRQIRKIRREAKKMESDAWRAERKMKSEVRKAKRRLK